MGKRLPHTPSSQIRSALRKLWMRSRERAAALKRDGYSCQVCGIKQSRAKGREVYVEVHHVDGVHNWAALIEAVRDYLLCDSSMLQTLCEECHKKTGEED
jgi:predicted HNH restriction endonuclease